jgi:uncharacterized protein (TIGR03545 family)
MRKWVRWWGIAVFILIILLVLGVWYLFADRIIANNIEETGELIIGAKVDVGKADLTLIPLGISLNSLIVADPNSPMQNLIEVDNISFHLDGKYLFERKVIINDMVIEGLKFNTKRKKSGEIKGAEPITVKNAIDDFILPLFDLSKLEEFVKQEKLLSIDAVMDVSQDIKRVENEWKAAIRIMPNMEDMREYQNRTNVIIADINNNKVSGLITHARGIKRLKEEIEKDIEDIKLNKKAMLIDIDSLETKKNRGLVFVGKDITQLRNKYTPDVRGFKNFSKYIFKDDILQQIDKGLMWYNRLEPLFDYAYKNLNEDYYGNEPTLFDGIDVQFPEHDPKPSFFVELAKLSFEQRIGNLSGEIINFTTQQNISGMPTSIHLSGSNLDFAESVNIRGLINHVNSKSIEDEISLAIRKQKINRTGYQIIEDWELNIRNGTIDRIFDINIHDGVMNGKLKLNFVGTSFGSNYLGDKNIIINSIDSVLSGISDFYVDIIISGTSGDYTTSISSNIDSIVDKAVRNIVRNEAKKVNDTITRVISDKTDKLINDIEFEIKQLALEIDTVDKILDEANNVLKILP